VSINKNLFGSKYSSVTLVFLLIVIVFTISKSRASVINEIVELFQDEVSVPTDEDQELSSSNSIDLPYPTPQPTSDPKSKFEPRTGIVLQPSNLRTEVEYNPETGEYKMYEKVGAFETGTPFNMSAEEYYAYSSQQSKDEYWRLRSKQQRRGEGSEEDALLNVGGETFEKVFGGSSVDVVPQGTAEISLGLKYNKNNNPSLTKKQQSSTTFDFDNRVQMSVTGKVGDKVSLTVKYDTEAQFEFDKEIKLEYEGDEDEIIKKIELGDVSFPVDNSLISGSQSLFGIKTELQFGKLFVSNVFSQQKGEFNTIEVKGGAQVNEFEVRSDDYDRNRHFFLSHYFRDNYEDAFYYLPEIVSGVQIEKIEIWVTQTSTGREDSRDILALTDLGERTGIDNNGNMSSKNYPTSNNASNLYSRIKRLSGIRDKNTVNTTMSRAGYEQYKDYEFVEKAVLLNPNQYTINQELGYVSLNSRIDESKVLGVSYVYSKNQKRYTVGEFSNEIKDSSSVVIVKLLKSTREDPQFNTWDLMMKNIYSIRGYQISKDDFKLDVYYEDDRTGTPIVYFPEGRAKGRPFLSLLNLDNINENNQPYSDGIFDFVENYTINSRRGYIMFPVIEPFGKTLADSIVDADMIRKYAYNQLYDSTLSRAREFTSKNKYLIKGSYKSSVSSEISLNATSVERGSVVVTAGGRTLIEDVDYSVDYSMGVVRILNQGVLESGTPIRVTSESNPLINMKTKRLWGTRLDYRFSKNINLGFTMLNLSEIPSSQKVGFNDYPINNTVWGLDGKYTTEVPFLTKAVDFVPLLSTKEESRISLGAEFAQLVPGKSKYIDDAIEIDYFEDTERRINLREPTSWYLASTPQGQRNLFPEASLIDNHAYGYNRAMLSWFDINVSFYDRNSPVSKDQQSYHYAREVYEHNLFENKEISDQIIRPMQILNLAYYPYERGPYNFDVEGLANYSSGLDPLTGRLRNPQERWGGIMRDINTDFEENNIEYIEFWMLDPFIYDEENRHLGGDLYINLGDVSEDILRDNRKQEEHALSLNPDDYDVTAWGHVPRNVALSRGFDNAVDRSVQDVGLDGLSDEAERLFHRRYLARLKEYVATSVYEKIFEDPSNDNFYTYLDDRGNSELDIIGRYKYIRNTEGNSPAGASQGGGSQSPDTEDINSDNTLQTSEAYFQYKVSIRKEDLVVGKNFCVDKKTEQIGKLANGQGASVEWYQFKIPVTSDMKQRVGNISDFKKINFMRMFLHGFNDSVVLRFASFGLISSKWRKYKEALYEPGEYDIFNDSEFDVSSVSLEQNSKRTPVNYILPPGVEREVDPYNRYMVQLNESALQVTVKDLDDGNSKAIYRYINKDFRQFGKLKMFVHAESIEPEMTEDDDITAFIRIGSDFTDNYYEYEVPLTITRHTVEGIYLDNNSIEDRYTVWPQENNIDIDFNILTDLKRERDIKMREAGETIDSYHSYSKKDGKNTVSVRGKPTLGNVRVIMIGVRNPRAKNTFGTDDRLPKSAILWFNELRLTDFNDKGGWAANSSARINFADFATLSLAGQTSKPGFGGLDQKVFERSLEEIYQYDIATNVSLNKFFPDDLGLSLPFYYDYSETRVNPKYDPTNTDILLEDVYSDFDDKEDLDSVKNIVQELTQRKSYNFTNVRINPKNSKKHILSISNFSTSYAYSKMHYQDININYDDEFNYRASLNYNYTLRPKNYEPFKSLKPKSLQLIKDFNFYLLPQQIGMDNRWNKLYRESQRRNLSYPIPLQVNHSKKFDWERNYSLKYNFSKNLSFTYDATNVSKIDEPNGIIPKTDEERYAEYKRGVWENIMTLGENDEYSQRFNINYKIPIDKIPAFSWITSNYRYSGTYNWIGVAEYRAPRQGDEPIDYGNEIKNSNTNSYDTRFNFRTLYRKSKYLSEIDKKYSRTRKTNPKTETVKHTATNVKLEANKPYFVNHRLKTETVTVAVLDANGRSVRGATEIISQNRISFIPEVDVENAQIVSTGRRDIVEGPVKKAFDITLYSLMMIKNASLNYSVSNGSYVPGYVFETQNFGLYDPFNQIGNTSPGWLYVGGYVPDDLEERAYSDNWLVTDQRMNTNYTLSYSTNLQVKFQLEPIRTMRINIDSDRRYSENLSKYLLGDKELNERNARTNGNFSISCNTISTAFDSEKVYYQFRENRYVIAHRLAEKRNANYEINPETGFPVLFTETSQDVLIPAFVAAYTGTSVDDVDTENYFHSQFDSFESFIKSLNWRLTYSGLSNIKALKKYFRSISLNHAYSSNYTIGNYQTFVAENMWDDLYENPLTFATQVAPMYEIGSVSISERFNPLVGVDMRWESNFTSKFEVKHSRTVSLSFVNTQITENSGMEYVIGAGYIFKDFILNIKTQGDTKTYQNDLTVRADFSVRDNQVVRRDIIQDYTQRVSGAKIYSLKCSAEYMLSQRFTIRYYFDFMNNRPFVNGFNNTSLSTGINLRFSLI
jgi:cell surface protein SprA